MANEEHVKLINKGVEAWNIWRGDNPELKPSLRRAHLSGADLVRADLSGADLREAELVGASLSWGTLAGADLTAAKLTEADLEGINLRKANLVATRLRGANLNGADLSSADLSGADLLTSDLSKTNLRGANFKGANLQRANLEGAILEAANLIGANLSRADLRGANLRGAILRGTELGGTILNKAFIEYATFGNTDLRWVNGLENVKQFGPSTIGVDTFSRSEGKIPASFLRGCGLSDWQIEAVKLHRTDLTNEEIGDILYRIHDLRAHQALQISPLFISYSHSDELFINKIERYFLKAGIRFWRDVHHATAGSLEKQIDRAIRLNPTVLIVLSKDSVQSDWVEHEVRLARKLAKEIKRDVLCPVALDESWKHCEWPERLREQIMEFNILDFSNWQDVPYFDRMYSRLIEGLNLFYTTEVRPEA